MSAGQGLQNSTWSGHTNCSMRNTRTSRASSKLFENYNNKIRATDYPCTEAEIETLMLTVGMYIDISCLVDAVVVGDIDRIIATGRELTLRGADASELIGRVVMIAAHGDSDGHTILTLAAASMMCRWLIASRFTLEKKEVTYTRGLPFFVRYLAAE